jgi:hypothetical protein
VIDSGAREPPPMCAMVSDNGLDVDSPPVCQYRPLSSRRFE